MYHVRDVVQHKLLVLLAMSLEVPEENLLETHKRGACSTEYYRFVRRIPSHSIVDFNCVIEWLLPADGRRESQVPWPLHAGPCRLGYILYLVFADYCSFAGPRLQNRNFQMG